MQLKQLLFVILLGLIAYVQAKSSDQLQIGILKKIPDTECPRKSKNGDKVSMHYIGTLADGTKFDASYDRGTPLEFTLGVGQVIKGWDQGLLDMCIGEKRKLTIPPGLGYGNRNIGPIPAGSTLIFEAELVDIKDKYYDEL